MMFSIIRRDNRAENVNISVLRNQLLYGYTIQYIIRHMLSVSTAEHAMRLLEKLCGFNIFYEMYQKMAFYIINEERHFVCNRMWLINTETCENVLRITNGVMLIPLLEGLFYFVFVCGLLRIIHLIVFYPFRYYMMTSNNLSIFRREMSVGLIGSFFFTLQQITVYLKIEKQLMEMKMKTELIEEIEQHNEQIHRLHAHAVSDFYYYYLLGINLYFLYRLVGFRNTIKFHQFYNFIQATGLIMIVHTYFVFWG